MPEHKFMSSTETTAASAKTINVAIIEDRREIREGLCMLINGTEGFVCTGKFGSMEEGLRRLQAADLPDVVLSRHRLAGNERHRRHQDFERTISRADGYNAYDLRRRRADFRRALRRRVRLSAEENAAGAPARKPERSGRRRLADVAGSGARASSPFSARFARRNASITI